VSIAEQTSGEFRAASKYATERQTMPRVGRPNKPNDSPGNGIPSAWRDLRSPRRLAGFKRPMSSWPVDGFGGRQRREYPMSKAYRDDVAAAAWHRLMRCTLPDDAAAIMDAWHFAQRVQWAVTHIGATVGDAGATQPRR
jgi:hypothetical protein